MCWGTFLDTVSSVLRPFPRQGMEIQLYSCQTGKNAWLSSYASRLSAWIAQQTAFATKLIRFSEHRRRTAGLQPDQLGLARAGRHFVHLPASLPSLDGGSRVSCCPGLSYHDKNNLCVEKNFPVSLHLCLAGGDTLCCSPRQFSAQNEQIYVAGAGRYAPGVRRGARQCSGGSPSLRHEPS